MILILSMCICLVEHTGTIQVTRVLLGFVCSKSEFILNNWFYKIIYSLL